MRPFKCNKKPKGQIRYRLNVTPRKIAGMKKTSWDVSRFESGGRNGGVGVGGGGGGGGEGSPKPHYHVTTLLQ